MNKLALAPVLLVLAACSPDPQTEESAPVETVESRPDNNQNPAETARNDPDSRQAMRDPDRREAMLEAMREQRAARGEGSQSRDADHAALRERMRERREQMASREDTEMLRERLRERRSGTSTWWEDPSIVERLGLETQQLEALGQAHQVMEQTRIESRQSLADSQRQLQAAIQDADREQIERLLEQRNRATAALAQAESDWLRAILDELTDEQLQTLAQSHPGALISRVR